MTQYKSDERDGDVNLIKYKQFIKMKIPIIWAPYIKQFT